MNRRQVSALLVLKELGIKSKMESFADRLSVQKGVYLAQATGVDLGHYFNWYLRGPYAPSLTQDVFDAIQNYDTGAASKGWQLDPKTRTTLSKLRQSLKPPATLAHAAWLWLELLASVHFLIDRKQVLTRDPGTLTSQLAKFGKRFTRTQVAEAVQRLEEAGLLPKPH